MAYYLYNRHHLSGPARKCMKNPGIKMFGQKGVSEDANSDTPMQLSFSNPFHAITFTCDDDGFGVMQQAVKEG